VTTRALTITVEPPPALLMPPPSSLVRRDLGRVKIRSVSFSISLSNCRIRSTDTCGASRAGTRALNCARRPEVPAPIASLSPGGRARRGEAATHARTAEPALPPPRTSKWARSRTLATLNTHRWAPASASSCSASSKAAQHQSQYHSGMSWEGSMRPCELE
jgi:hypothetical protein